MSGKSKAAKTERRSADQDAALEEAFAAGKLPEADRRAEVSGELVEAADEATQEEVIAQIEEEQKPEEFVSAEEAERIQEQLWRERKLPGQVNHPEFGSIQSD